jgi:hypothetical protein
LASEQRLVPHRFSKAKVNAGYNYLPLNEWVNSIMNGKGILPTGWNRGVVAGMYGALARNANHKC